MKLCSAFAVSCLCIGIQSTSALTINPVSNWLDGLLSHDDKHFMRGGSKGWHDTLADYDVPTTDTGRVEADTSPGVLDWRAPPRSPGRASVKTCEPQCDWPDLCWDGQCIYRPWAFHDEPRPNCVANPTLPGLTERDRRLCEGSEAEMSMQSCLSVAEYCIWAPSGPRWFFHPNGGPELAGGQ
mmetsp:Transcript_61009/g.145377  ORF Transcript_61009/g.145377 Transcript_61009/m.145377 type:complete len:183 (+) Transcript_61009:59-607(+)